jgi:hypothetical protein
MCHSFHVPVARPARLALALLLLSLAGPAFGQSAHPNPEHNPFRKLARPALPASSAAWVRNPIDAYIFARLAKAGIQPSADAQRLALLRRVTYDLTGLAPSPAETEAFLADASPDAYERVVDRLLQSPHFGERWAQHWLDVVRYSETEGFKVDRYRPDAWRYRDYIIRAFNEDLPYDRFVQQQLAGDELEPENPEALIATGFLRLHAEETNGANYQQIRQDVLDDITEVTGLAFMGMTIGCARCHDHKFDPVSQQDYFRLQAFFAGVVQKDDVPLLYGEARKAFDEKHAVWSEKTQSLRDELAEILKPVMRQVFEESVVALDEATQEALKADPATRTAMQCQLATLGGKQIFRKHEKMHRRLKGNDKTHYDEVKKKLDAFDAIKPEMPVAMAVVDAGRTPPPTHVLGGGDYRRVKKEVQPGFPECLDPPVPEIKPLPSSSGRRAALARWLTRPDHPMTSRVIVNRLWHHYFGKGIVATPNDFGNMGQAATHPELLDFLATELVAKGWKLKAIHRLIVTSAAYRQTADADDNATFALAQKLDPENRLCWRANVRRRDGESIRDCVLQASGELNPRMFDLSACPELPPEILSTSRAWYPDERVEDRNRRSVYVFNRRNLTYPLFSAFDAPNRSQSCAARTTTVTAPQALLMLNGEFTMTQARVLSGRLLAKHRDFKNLIEDAYLHVLGRRPSDEDLSAAELFLRQQSERIAKGPAPTANALPTSIPQGVDTPFAAAVLDLCHALMNSAEFAYIE